MKKIYLQIKIAIILVIVCLNVLSQESYTFVRQDKMMREDGGFHLSKYEIYNAIGEIDRVVHKYAGINAVNFIDITDRDMINNIVYSITGTPSETQDNPGYSGFYEDYTFIKNKTISKNNNDQKPFSKAIYERSPLKREIEYFGLGGDWHNKGKSVRTFYLTNLDSGIQSCMAFSVDGIDTNTTLRKKTNYSAGELDVVKIIDEDENTSYEFKNRLGQTLLTT